MLNKINKHYFIGGGFMMYLMRFFALFMTISTIEQLMTIFQGQAMIGHFVLLVLDGGLALWDFYMIRKYARMSNEERENMKRESEEIKRLTSEKIAKVRERHAEKRATRPSRSDKELESLKNEFHKTRAHREAYFHLGRELTYGEQAEMDQLATHERLLQLKIDELQQCK